MAKCRLSKEDKEYFEKCPVCGEGYMVPTVGDWYECTNCGVEAEMDEYGLLMYDESVEFLENGVY